MLGLIVSEAVKDPLGARLAAAAEAAACLSPLARLADRLAVEADLCTVAVDVAGPPPATLFFPFPFPGPGC